jgi:nucleoside 2-deoxyribosyltransferase
MVMPFRDKLIGIYEEIIIPLAQELSLEIRRGNDRQQASADIMEEVVAYIASAKIVIVDCTEIDDKPNGNVYYELGYADALGKNNVILISQTNATTLPFDIKHRGVIEYQDNARGNRKLKEDLKQAIQSILGES